MYCVLSQQKKLFSKSKTKLYVLAETTQAYLISIAQKESVIFYIKPRGWSIEVENNEIQFFVYEIFQSLRQFATMFF